jgi:hypothetical protein
VFRNLHVIGCYDEFRVGQVIHGGAGHGDGPVQQRAPGDQAQRLARQTG